MHSGYFSGNVVDVRRQLVTKSTNSQSKGYDNDSISPNSTEFYVVIGFQIIIFEYVDTLTNQMSQL